MLEWIKKYLSDRLSERSTKLMVGMVVILIAKILAPKEYADTIDQIALAFGIGGAAVPDKKQTPPN